MHAHSAANMPMLPRDPQNAYNKNMYACTHTKTHMHALAAANKVILPKSLRFNALFKEHMSKSTQPDAIDIGLPPTFGGSAGSEKTRNAYMKLKKSVKVSVVVNKYDEPKEYVWNSPAMTGMKLSSMM
jgi:hypothetical protein